MFLRHTTDDENNVGTWERGHMSTWALDIPPFRL